MTHRMAQNVLGVKDDCRGDGTTAGLGAKATSAAEQLGEHAS